MAKLDLKPINKETIQELGINNHELWIVRFGEEIFGPFEIESLRQYASENQDLFDEAESTHLENHDWKPFYSHALFQRRGPQVLKLKEANHEGPYWLLDLGQKIGPLSQHDLDKRLELGSIGMTELISTDDGHTWHKLYQIEGFNRRFHSSSELPFSPLESNFQKSRLELMERLESQSVQGTTNEQLAELAHTTQIKAQVLPFRAEDVPLGIASEASISSNLKWQVPTAIAVVLTLIMGLRLTVNDPSEEAIDIASNEIIPTSNAKTNSQSAKIKTPKPKQNNHIPNPSLHQMPVRKPASHQPQTYTVPSRQNDDYARESEFPTHMETHQADYPAETEQNDNYGHVNDYQDQEPSYDQENREPASVDSLVGGQLENKQTLDDVMGNPSPIEEVSDF